MRDISIQKNAGKKLTGNVIMKLYEDLQKYHNYTDYQIKLVRYVLKTLASEISKFLIIGAFFLIIGKLPEFLFAAVLLLFFRRYNGGLHCKTYVTCLLASFLFFFAGVLALPALVTVPYVTGVVVLITLTVLIPVLAPVKGQYHAELQPEQIKRYRLWTLAVMIVVTLLYFFFPESVYFIIAFWIAAIHACQLYIAIIIERRCNT